MTSFITSKDNVSNEELLSSQTVRFLDETFDNTVLLQKSIRAVKQEAKDKLFPCNDTTKKKADRITNSVSISNNSVSNQATSKRPLQLGEITDKHKEIRSWGLPDEIATKYEKRGLRVMFDWQVECLGNTEVLHNYKNLLYSAPTSAGKTLVAEILSIKTVLERQKKVIVILPFVSVVREKMFYFQEMFSSSGLRVEGFMGSHTPPGGFQSIHIAICTIEKANNLVNQLLQEGRISIVGAVVVDEFHLLGDASRGYILELLLTKLKYVTSYQDIDHIQIIGMSATLPNLSTLADWLNAELYVTNFRPIPLHEGMITENKIYDSDMTLQRELAIIDDVKNDSDHVIQLCLETINENCSVLIFCSTKNWCENLCQNLASAFYKLGCSSTELGTMLKKQLDSSKIVEVLELLSNCPVGIDSVLKKTISFGVAFHHAGLSLDERDIIEGAFKSGAIRVLVATSTLSSGVNLPARRVIVRSPLFQNKSINILTYKQMIGRAGRMGKDDKGESILICTKAEQNIGRKLMLGELDPVVSCIQGGDKFMRAILEAIASQVVNSFAEIENYARCTLLFHEEKSTNTLAKLLNDTLEYLHYSELLKLQNNNEFCSYMATALGKACLSASLAPNDALSLFFELQKARQCVVLENDFHLLYLVTPYSVSSQWANLDWIHFFNIWENLSITMKRVSELIGVQESFICHSMRNVGKGYKNDNKLQVYKRFYVALALQDLVNEEPLINVAEKFKCSRGQLQSLQQSAATFAGMVTAFCRQLGWKNLELLISQFQDRLHFGIQADLIDLMKLQSLNGSRARSLHSAGIESICELASANIIDVENALNAALPFESNKKRQGETEIDALKRNKLKNIWITGICGLTIQEAAENLISEARKYLQWQIGVNKINWDNNNSLPIIQKCIYNNDSLCETDSNNGIVSSKSNESNLVHLEKNYSSTNNTQQSKTTISDLDKKEQISKIENLRSLIPLNISSDKSKYNFTITDSKLKPTKNISSTEMNASLFEESWCGTDHMHQLIDNNKTFPSTSLEVSGDGSNNNLVSVNRIGSLENAFLSTFEDDTDKMTLYYDESYDGLNIEMSTIVLESLPCSDVLLNGGFMKNNFDQSSSQFHIARDDIDFQRSDYKYIDLFVPKYGTFANNLCSRNSTECEMTKLHYSDSFNELNLSKLLEHLHTLSYLTMFIHFEKIQPKNKVIGSNIVGKQSFDKLRNVKATHVCNNTALKGIAFYTEEHKCYYISCKYMEGQLFNKFEALFRNPNTIIYVHWLKSIYLHMKSYDIEIMCKYRDISIMDWLIDSGADEKLLHKLAGVYCNIDISLAYYEEMSNNETHSKKLNENMVSCIKAWAICQIAKKQLETLNLQYANVCPVLDVQSRVACILADSENCGIRVDKQFVAKLLSDVKVSQDKLQTKAYRLVGYRFNFNSTKDIAKILGLCKGIRKVSTKKSVLKAHHTPLSYLILYWRKLNTILTKSLYPLTAKAVLHTDTDRIYTSYITHTSTGRVCMREPNIQNIPRTFEMPVYFLEPDKAINLEENCDMVVFNCRKAITANPGWKFVSADYCQLEMRLLTHMCHDDKLVKIMKSKCDVFAKIAASLGNVNEKNVTDELRHMAKQICYGIIYGMGTKTLAEQLDVTELEASTFMDTFHNTYTAIRHFTNTVIEKCKQRGYVETLMKRRRYLPAINSVKISERRHAERQAVNTTIQGSAADIVKSAMIAVSDSLKSHGIEQKTKLMLQMHDELIYEVEDCTCQHFIEILKTSMECSVQLTIPMPVKMKIGSNWGEMTEIHLAGT